MPGYHFYNCSCSWIVNYGNITKESVSIHFENVMLDWHACPYPDKSESLTSLSSA